MGLSSKRKRADQVKSPSKPKKSSPVKKEKDVWSEDVSDEVFWGKNSPLLDIDLEVSVI